MFQGRDKLSFVFQALDFLAAYRKTVGWALAGTAIVISAVLWGRFSHAEKTEGVQVALMEWLSGSSKATPKEVSRWLEKDPIVHAAFAGIAAQKFLILKEPRYAEKYAKEGLCAVNPYSSYRDFSKASFLIAQEKWSKALESAIALKNHMDKNPSLYQENLYVMNLLRIGMLQKHLGDSSAEKQAWEDLQKALANPAMKQAYFSLVQYSKTEDVTFQDFVEMRKKTL